MMMALSKKTFENVHLNLEIFTYYFGWFAMIRFYFQRIAEEKKNPFVCKQAKPTTTIKIKKKSNTK